MNRRELLLGASALAFTATTSGTAFAAGGHKHDEHHHEGAGDLLKALAHCDVEAKLCSAHLYDVIKEGDNSVVDCQKALISMMDVCRATGTLATTDSSAFKAILGVAISTLKECENECRKHEKKHEICKTTADSCVECVKACKKAMKG